MSRYYNNFCKYCTGNKVQEIRECEDRTCPFYQFRRGGLEKNVEEDIYKKMLQDTGSYAKCCSLCSQQRCVTRGWYNDKQRV